MNSSKPPKIVTLRLRASAAEADALRTKADKAGLTLSEFVRRAALGRRIDSVIDRQAIALLRQLGGLQKHLALHDPSHAAEYRAMHQALMAAVHAVQAAADPWRSLPEARTWGDAVGAEE
ncbi:MAG: plasmid mobilization protein [Acidiferrobacterales bacterium]